ncbi:MAG TPA: Fe-S cluster assembly protein SufD [Gemmatimonadaceae bacterium]|nr:Fe-S cluster assembly protein SufD [Gemmatimonadaceae bacterium]
MISIVTQPESPVHHYLESLDELLGGKASRVAELRVRAMDRFVSLGFPSMKNEDWHYTSVAPVATRVFNRSPSAAPGAALDVAPMLFGAPTWPRLVFVDGWFAPELSHVADRPGVRVSTLAALLADGDSPDVGRLGEIANHDTAAFTALNTALMQDGAVISIGAGVEVDVPIHLLFISTGPEALSASFPRNLLVLERSAKATVIESYAGVGDETYLTVPVTEISLGDGARLEHIKVQNETAGAFHVGTVQARQERDSELHSFSYAAGAELSRTNIYTLLDGPGSSCTMNGMYMVSGLQHVDHQTRIEHAQPNTTSREVYKGILDGHSHGVFNGKVYVRPEAQKTDGKQSNNNLLLSQHARVDTKPQLEIFADDVKCTHGATIGRLDEVALFYMKSRGLDAEQARTLLIYAFAAEVLEEIPVKAVRDALEAAVFARVRGEQLQVAGD